MQKPKISIVTPSYNQARFLEDSIQSVLNQKYENLEYIIVDAGSTDGSVEIIKKYESHLKFWCSEPDGGQSAGINKGFAHATGDIIAWINSDDFYHKDAFATVAEIWEKADTKPGLIFGDGSRSDINGKVFAHFWPRKPFFDLTALIYGIDYILQPTTFFNRLAFNQVGGLNNQLHYCMDYELWIKLGQKYPVLTTDKCLASSREYDETKTNTGGFKRIEEIRRMLKNFQPLEITPGVTLSLLHDLKAFILSNNHYRDFYTRRSLGLIEEITTEVSTILTAFASTGDGWPDEISDIERIKQTLAKEQSADLTQIDHMKKPFGLNILKLQNLVQLEENGQRKSESQLHQDVEESQIILHNLITMYKELSQTCVDRLHLIQKLHEDHKHAVSIIDKTENSLPFKIYRKFRPNPKKET